MISFRYHLVSVIGIFLAIALGVVIGTTALNGAVVGDLHHQVKDLKASNAKDSQQITALQAAAANGDTLATSYGNKIVAGSLTGVGVVLLGTPDATAAMQDAVASEVQAAGGSVTGRIQLTKAFIDPARANDVTSLATSVHPINLQLPASTDDPGTLAGALLGFVLFGKGQPTDITTVLAGFSTLNMLTTSGAAPTAGKLLVVVTSAGYAKGSVASQTLLSLTSELAQAGGPTMVAGDTASAAGGGLVAAVRGDGAARTAVSTVDDADTPTGQVSTVLTGAELSAGRKGHYGTAAGVDALMPGTGH